MDVKQAVATAKRYIEEVFADEGIADIGLEEVEFDDARNVWNITTGFSRERLPVDTPPLGAFLTARRRVRTYKVVRISDKSGKVLSVKNREPVE
jgi:hypothetical protein